MTTMTKKQKAAKKRKSGKPKSTSVPNPEFRALVDSLHGSMSWLNVTVDGYLREKHAEVDAENEK